MLAMRNHPISMKTYKEFLTEVKENALNAYENQDYPFDQLVIKRKLQGRLNRNPLFDTVLQMNPDETGTGKDNLNENPLKITTYPLENPPAVFDLVLFAVETPTQVQLTLRYAAFLFKRSRIEKMTHHYIEILEQITGNINIHIKDISMSHKRFRAESKALMEQQEEFGF
jgi:non-ribosomal peptide synthetase component F